METGAALLWIVINFSRMKNFSLLKFFGVFALVLAVGVNAYAQTNLSFVSNLDIGSRGSEVMNLQKCLTENGVFHVAPTGYYGSITAQAVQEFQARNGIVSSGTPSTTGYGRVGPKTRAALNIHCKEVNNIMPVTAGTNGANSIQTNTSVPEQTGSVDLTATQSGFNMYRLSWTSKDVLSCTSNDFYINDALVSTSGSVDVQAPLGGTTYSISCLTQNGTVENTVSDSIVLPLK